MRSTDQRKLSPVTIGLIFVFVLLATSFIGTWQYASELTEEAMEKESRPSRVLQEYRLGYRISYEEKVVLTPPIGCEQFIAKQNHDWTWKTYCVSADLSKRKRNERS